MAKLRTYKLMVPLTTYVVVEVRAIDKTEALRFAPDTVTDEPDMERQAVQNLNLTHIDIDAIEFLTE